MVSSVEPEEVKHYNFNFERPNEEDSYFGGEVTEDYLSYS